MINNARSPSAAAVFNEVCYTKVVIDRDVENALEAS